MTAMVLFHWLWRRSGDQADQPLPYCERQELPMALPTLSAAKPFPDGEKADTAEVDPFVQM